MRSQPVTTFAKLLLGSNMRAAFHANVRGIVQGVAFRFWTQQNASELGLSGFVRNLADRSVELVAVGDRVSLEQLAERLHHGPRMARVDKVSINWLDEFEEFEEFEGFMIRY